MLRFYALILAAIALGPVYALLLGALQPVLESVLVSLGVALAALAYFRWRKSRVTRALLTLFLALCVPTHYGATGKVIQGLANPRQDEALIHADDWILGWMIPRGQLSLWIDQNAWIGPHTVLGKTLTELFQVFYFSYYFWGYGLVIFLAVQAWKKPLSDRWETLQKFLCAWLGAYLVNFVCYIFLPAIGPKYFYPELFVNSVDGWGFARQIQDFIQSNQATAEDCFPSGHTALSWITALCALRIVPRYGKLATFAAIMITMATLYLRYHYVADVLGAIPLVLTGLAWGGFLMREKKAVRGPVTVLNETVTQ